MKNYLKIFLIFILILSVLFSINTNRALAFIGFGGQIIATITCTNGVLLFLGQPSSGAYLFSPTSKIYSFYNLMPSTWLLGTFTPGGVCNMGPYSISVMGTIKTVGTSE